MTQDEHPSAISFLKAATPVLRALVRQYQATLPAPEFQDFIDHLRGLSDRVEAELAPLGPGPSRALAVQRLIDRDLAQLRGVRPTCCRGCCACCHLEVEITRDDGELLAREVLAGHEVDRQRLAAQASRERRGAEWTALVAPENRCVFLAGDGACSVYPIRPSVCRKHLVVSPAADCAQIGATPVPVTIPMAELILSVAIGQPENGFASLAKSLEAGLKKQPQP